MKPGARWSRCIYHLGRHVAPFLRDYLADGRRRVLLIGGAGFDPRSTRVCDLLAEIVGGRLDAVFLREDRPGPAADLVARAARHEEHLISLVPHGRVEHIQIFADDNAVVGGRKVVSLVDSLRFDGLTDVFVDLSALSVGISFPVVRYLHERAKSGRPGSDFNLHVVVADEPVTDEAIESTPCDKPSTVHGFMGDWGRDDRSDAAKLWLPQLIRGGRNRVILERIFRSAEPHTVCPILPFPASEPRLPDELIELYGDEFQNSWKVDARDLVYADEKSPVDLYRSILRIDDARSRVYERVGGSLIVLSPVGSKALSIGALMAALERDFTVMYVESASYSVDFGRVERDRTRHVGDMVHVWLHGEAYATPEGMEATGP